MSQHRMRWNLNSSDEELMIAYANGDTSAFELLYRRYSGKILGYLIRRTQDPIQAEDLFQKIFLKLHASASTYQDRFPVGPWIFTISHSVLTDWRRSRGYREERLWDVYDEDVRPDGILDETSRESAHRVQETLTQLESSDKKVLEMRYLNELPFEEISRHLGLSESGVRQRVSRALRRIRKGLAHGP